MNFCNHHTSRDDKQCLSQLRVLQMYNRYSVRCKKVFRFTNLQNNCSLSLHKARNVVIHLYYSFQLRPLAVAWQSDKLKSANFLKFRNRIFVFFLAHAIGMQLVIHAGLYKFAEGSPFLSVCIAFDRRCIVFLVWFTLWFTLSTHSAFPSHGCLPKIKTTHLNFYCWSLFSETRRRSQGPFCLAVGEQ